MSCVAIPGWGYIVLVLGRWSYSPESIPLNAHCDSSRRASIYIYIYIYTLDMQIPAVEDNDREKKHALTSQVTISLTWEQKNRIGISGGKLQNLLFFGGSHIFTWEKATVCHRWQQNWQNGLTTEFFAFWHHGLCSPSIAREQEAVRPSLPWNTSFVKTTAYTSSCTDKASVCVTEMKQTLPRGQRKASPFGI